MNWIFRCDKWYLVSRRVEQYSQNHIDLALVMWYWMLNCWVCFAQLFSRFTKMIQGRHRPTCKNLHKSLLYRIYFFWRSTEIGFYWNHAYCLYTKTIFCLAAWEPHALMYVCSVCKYFLHVFGLNFFMCTNHKLCSYYIFSYLACQQHCHQNKTIHSTYIHIP